MLIAFLLFGLFLYAAANVLIVPLVTQVNTLLKAMPGLAAKANESISCFWAAKPRSCRPIPGICSSRPAAA